MKSLGSIGNLPPNCISETITETFTDVFSKDERELISPAITGIDCSNGFVRVTVVVRKCFGLPVEETLHFNEETLLKMLRQIKQN